MTDERSETGNVHCDRCRGIKCPCYVDGLATAKVERGKAEVYSANWVEAERALAKAADALSALEALIRRLDWSNIHTHYGFTATCDDCNLVAMLTQSQAVNG